MFNQKFTAMKKHLYYSLLGISMMALVGTTSCKKDDNTSVDNGTTYLSYAKDADQVDSYLDEVSNEADEVMSAAESKSLGTDSTIDQGSKGRRVRYTHRYYDQNKRIDTIKYENFVSKRQGFTRTKNGMIIIEQTGGPLQDTFVRKITFSNFTINGHSIEGTKTITKIANYTFSITFEGKITFKDGTTHTRSYTRTRTWIAGYDTPLNVWDDVYSIEGSAQGTNRKGISYTHTITKPLIIRADCPYIVVGTVEMIVGKNQKTITINYGEDQNSTCDGTITVTVDGETKQVQLDANE